MKTRIAAGLAGALWAAALGSHAVSAEAISDGVVKIGVLNDQSGIYVDMAGPGSVIAAPTGRSRHGVSISPSRMAGSGHWALLRWRTRSSSGRWWRF